MKPIVAKDQVRLSAARCLQLTLAGMYYRFTRSTITVAIVALAVAFLTYMLAYSVCVLERTHAAYEELRDLRQLGMWTARLSSPDPLPDVVTAVVSGDTSRLREYRRWGGIASDSSFGAVQASFKRFHAFLSFFADMRPVSKAVLLGDADPYQLAKQLSNADNCAVFVRQLGELALAPPLGSEADLRAFVADDWPVVVRFCEAVRAGQQAAIDSVRAASGNRGLVAWISQDPEAVAALGERLGYASVRRQVATLQRQARESGEERAFTRVLGTVEVRSGVARLLDIDPKHVDIAVVTAWLGGAGRAELLHKVMAEANGAVDVPTAAQLAGVAKRYQRTAQLQQALGAETLPATRGLRGVPQATRWLIIVSFLVCAVGICNTMFMSVTERFTEIATMKCLGAMDSFVMLMFVFEAALQGVAGSFTGIVAGFVLAALRGLWGYGTMFFESAPWESLGIVAGGSVVVGIVLAAASAVGPAWMAARLAPMEAMRVE